LLLQRSNSQSSGMIIGSGQSLESEGIRGSGRRSKGAIQLSHLRHMVDPGAVTGCLIATALNRRIYV
jgi:hypothetical protein